MDKSKIFVLTSATVILKGEGEFEFKGGMQEANLSQVRLELYIVTNSGRVWVFHSKNTLPLLVTICNNSNINRNMFNGNSEIEMDNIRLKEVINVNANRQLKDSCGQVKEIDLVLLLVLIHRKKYQRIVIIISKCSPDVHKIIDVTSINNSHFNSPEEIDSLKSSRSEDTCLIKQNVHEFLSDLTKWAVECKLQREYFNELLNLIRICGRFPREDIPKDSRTLLHTPRHVDVVDKCGGKYVYLGLRKEDTKMSQQYKNYVMSQSQQEDVLHSLSDGRNDTLFVDKGYVDFNNQTYIGTNSKQLVNCFTILKKPMSEDLIAAGTADENSCLEALVAFSGKS
ncbi:uncharacterized protein LOC136091962 [Hydra vulgaris]|uniref:Uncharacterized protein LOC136091962 n=1 Tax=Hydra vulgaris TaxID=6087 RepID=A0ABM4DMG0_HYDVU